MAVYIKRCKEIYDKYVADEMTVYAAQASFFIILSAFPFIMVLLTMIQLFPDLTQENLVELLIAILPRSFSYNYGAMIISAINDLYTKSPGTILSITVIAALWSASRGMLSIERGFNRVLGCTKKRNYFLSRLICSGYTIVFMAVFVLSLALLVLGDALQNIIYQYFPIFRDVFDYVLNLRTLFALAILISFFVGLYTYLPHKKLPLRGQLPGAIFTTVCWIGFSLAFSIYFQNFSRFSYMYGSLTAIVLLMLWLYVCICILFLGAEINDYLQENYEPADKKLKSKNTK